MLEKVNKIQDARDNNIIEFVRVLVETVGFGLMMVVQTTSRKQL